MTTLNTSDNIDVVLGRSAPVPKGPQVAAESLPVVLATDQAAVPVQEVNKTASEVELSLLGIRRTESTLGIFADVTTYDANPQEWQASRRESLSTAETTLAGTSNGTAFEHIPAESAARVVSGVAGNSSDFYAILSSRRFFRYQPGRISAGTFGVSMSVSNNATDIKKWGLFDKYNGYYFEVQGGQTASDFNFYCVRRSDAFSAAVSPGSGETGTAGTDLVITRDGLPYIHAGLFDKSLRVDSGGVEINAGQAVTFRVATEFQYVYEYRVPRKYFSHDRMDATSNQVRYYSDKVPAQTAFTVAVAGTADAPILTFTNGSALDSYSSVWSLNFSQVTMYRVEYSWYGAIGATFLAYVPDGNTAGDARWVRIHTIRCSNQTRLPSLGNAFLPITYYAAKGTASLSWIKKYGASYYIDGGDKGTSVIRTANTAPASLTDGQASLLLGLQVKTTINSVRNRMQVYPIRLAIGSTGRAFVELMKNGTVTNGSYASAGTLSPINVDDTPSNVSIAGGEVFAAFQVGSGGFDIDLTPYFGFDKQYLSFPLTAQAGDTLWVRVTPLGGNYSVACGLTWEEQS